MMVTLLFHQAPYTSNFFHKCDIFVTFIFRAVKHYSIHILQLGFVNDFIDPTIDTIILNWLTSLNVLHVCRSVHEVVYLKCFSSWAANEYYFYPFIRTCWTLDKWLYIIFIFLYCLYKHHHKIYTLPCRLSIFLLFSSVDTIVINFIWICKIVLYIH